MDIRELEFAVRAIVEGNPGRPALAGVTGLGNAQLPEEFRNAARTLASRTHKSAHGQSILHSMTQSWA